MVDGLVVVFLLLVVEHTEVEIGLKVFWVETQSFLVQLRYLIEYISGGCGAYALSETVQSIDIIWIHFPDLFVDGDLNAELRN